MTLLAESYIHTTEQPTVPPKTAVDRGVMPRRPDASGEQPLYRPPTFAFLDQPVRPPRPDTTARIVVSLAAAAPAEPERPWFYRGRYRWTRSRGLLVAATWPGGAW